MLVKKTYKVAVIIPAYNEINNLNKVIKKLKGKYKIIIVNDGSDDNTDFKSLKNKRIHVLTHKYNQGYDYALVTGFKYVYKKKFDFAVSFDADDQFYVSDLEKFIKIIAKDNYDLIIGERYKLQRLGEVLSGFLFNLKFKIKDPFCGLKIYKLKKVKKSKFLELSHKKFFGLQFLRAYTNKNYKCLKIKTKPRVGKTKLKNSILVNFMMIYATFYYLINNINK